MAVFRSLLEAQGFTGIKTLLNSGNAVFSSAGHSAAAHAKAMEVALDDGLGLKILVVVKSSSEFLAAVADNPWAPAAAEHARFLVAFAQTAQAIEALSAVQPLVQTPERFSMGQHAAYLRCASGILESPAASGLLGKLGRGITTRNWATVLKLKELLAGEA